MTIAEVREMIRRSTEPKPLEAGLRLFSSRLRECDRDAVGQLIHQLETMAASQETRKTIDEFILVAEGHLAIKYEIKP